MSSSVSLGWTAATDNFSVSSYDIFRNGTFLTNKSTGSRTTFYNGSLRTGSAYTYTVAAKDPTGNTAAQSNAATATTGASAPR